MFTVLRIDCKCMLAFEKGCVDFSEFKGWSITVCSQKRVLDIGQLQSDYKMNFLFLYLIPFTCNEFQNFFETLPKHTSSSNARVS